jgi:seryl-tRNA synthetase
MAEFRPGTPDQDAFREELVAAGLLVESGVPGLYGRGEDFDDVMQGVERMVRHAAEPEQPIRLRFPPLLPRKQLEALGYFTTFPQLAGVIHGFGGEDGTSEEPTELAMIPAACYPVYPAIAARGPLPPGGVMVDAGGAYVFRHEPSGDPARMQMFHQREMVRLGEPETVAAWRDAWRDRALELLRGLGLAADFAVAADPFFGRAGRMLRVNQLSEELKFEVQVQIAGDEPTAVASFNYHRDHFATVYGLEMEGGGEAHTACLGFGLERIALALFRTHGLERTGWPSEVTEALA